MVFKCRVSHLLLLLLGLSLSSWGKSYSAQEIDQLIQSQYASWGIQPLKTKTVKDPSIQLEKALKIFKMNRPVTVAVVDTGIDYSHPFLQESLYFKNKKATPSEFGMDFSLKKVTTRPHDEHGHGTHVAGIIRSIFPDVRILPVKYFSPKASGQQNLAATIKALRYAVEANVDIINYSGGGPEASSQEKEILELARKKGILVVAAAGNDGKNIDSNKEGYYPASYRLSNIISVGSYNPQVRLLNSSNWGDQTVDLAAPGYRINSAFIQPKQKTNSEIANALAATSPVSEMMTGTSQATAFVTGAAALIKSMYPHYSAEKIKSIIVETVEKEKQFEGKVASAGRLDISKALLKAKELQEPTQKQKKKKITQPKQRSKSSRQVARDQ